MRALRPRLTHERFQLAGDLVVGLLLVGARGGGRLGRRRPLVQLDRQLELEHLLELLDRQLRDHLEVEAERRRAGDGDQLAAVGGASPGRDLADQLDVEVAEVQLRLEVRHQPLQVGQVHRLLVLAKDEGDAGGLLVGDRPLARHVVREGGVHGRHVLGRLVRHVADVGGDEERASAAERVSEPSAAEGLSTTLHARAVLVVT
jgi:hypothetical protein